MKGHETNDATYYTRLKCLEEKKARKKQGGGQCLSINVARSILSSFLNR